MRMCLNWVDFTKNVSFKSYDVIRLPRWALVGHILVWERVHAPWSGIPGVLRVQCSAAAGHTLRRLSLGIMYVHAWSILLQYVLPCMVNTATICIYIHAWSILLQYVSIYMHGQYCCNMYLHVHVYTCIVNTATICIYKHGQYCYNMHLQAWSVLLQYVWTINEPCMHTHGTYPGLPGSVPQIPYSLHMLTTLGRSLLGQGKGIVGKLGTLLSCTTLCSLS